MSTLASLHKMSTSGTHTARYGHSSVLRPQSNQIFTIAGLVSTGSFFTLFSDIYVMSLTDNTVTTFVPSNGSLAKRYSHTSTYLSAFDTVVTIAGWGNSEQFSDVVVLDCTSNSLSDSLINANISARSGHTATAINSKDIIVIGGYSKDLKDVLTDVWKLSMTSSTQGSWSQLPVNSNFGFREHSASYDSLNFLIYISGGNDLSGVYKLNIQTNTMNLLTSSLKLFSHSSQFINNQLYLFFGSSNGAAVTSIQVFNPLTNNITTITTNGTVSIGRSDISSVYDSSSNLVYLIDGNDRLGNELSEIWVFNYAPIYPSKIPSFQPTNLPSSPSIQPSIFSSSPTSKPSRKPTSSTSSPSQKPSFQPTNFGSTNNPSSSTQPSLIPSQQPSLIPTNQPTSSTNQPSSLQTKEPSQKPSPQPSNQPTFFPSISPTSPTNTPTQLPSFQPSDKPTNQPISPTFPPSNAPTQKAKSSHSNNNIGLIAGVVVGAVVLLVLSIVYFFRKKVKSTDKENVNLSSKNPISESKDGNESIEMIVKKEKLPSLNSFFSFKNILSSASHGNSNFPVLTDANSFNSINWKEIIVDVSRGMNVIVGRGSFGAVIRAEWKRNGRSVKDVAIKVLERKFGETPEQYQVAVKRAKEELMILNFAESQIGSDHIVKAFGLAEGQLSKQLQDMFHTSMDTVGIVMRYEAGGNLGDYLHGKNKEITTQLNMKEKMSLLVGIAQGLSELHSVGIIHGDIKPENILLDRIPNPKVRLADFGLSTIMEKHVGSNNVSTLRETKHVRGTLTYCAPEMLHDPRNPKKIEVAKASRKTDIFAFGIVTWEVLTQTRPFKEVSTEGELSILLHNEIRPDLKELSSATPPGIVELLPKMWAQERSERVSAMEVFSTCRFVSEVLASSSFDIFFSHAWASKPFLSHVFRELTKAGYRVWYDQNDMGHDLTKSMRNGILNSKVVLACVNPLYQTRDNCIFELREARKANKNIISLVIEGNPFEWANDEMKEICDFKRKMFVNISSVASLPWGSESGGSLEMIENLKEQLIPLLALLKESHCLPSLENINKEGNEFTL